MGPKSFQNIIYRWCQLRKSVCKETEVAKKKSLQRNLQCQQINCSKRSKIVFEILKISTYFLICMALKIKLSYLNSSQPLQRIQLSKQILSSINKTCEANQTLKLKVNKESWSYVRLFLKNHCFMVHNLTPTFSLLSIIMA